MKQQMARLALASAVAMALAPAAFAMGGQPAATGQSPNGENASAAAPQTATANQTTGTPDAGKGNGGKTASDKEAKTLQGVQVQAGLLRSQMQSIDLKRTAPDIQDSITSVSIGQLPDITIADSLQRVTGVQVDQTAGEGSQINIRGLPEVQTLINGESFLSADNIDSNQPNYETLPSELFSGVDVLKSATANNLTSGISGTVNLRTQRPWDLPSGWTVAGTVEGGRGSVTDKTKPSGNLELGYNDNGKWGILVGASYSDFVHNWGTQGWQPNQTGVIAGENAASAGGPLGYLDEAGTWDNKTMPSQIVRLADGSVDVNGDGKSDGAFYSPPRLYAANQLIQPKRTGLNSSFQYDFGSGFTLTADGFYNKEDQTTLIASIYALPVSQQAPTSLPAQSTPTNAILTSGAATGQRFYTVQSYNLWPGDVEPESTGNLVQSIARNWNLKLDYDNGGAFTGSVRYVNATASQVMNNATIDLSNGDGSQWPTTMVGTGALAPLPPTEYAGPNGNYAFNPNGLPAYAYPISYNLTGENPAVSLPAALRQQLANENSYVAKSIYGNSSAAHSGMNIVRADGNFRFNDNLNVDFGLRSSIRSAYLNTYDYTAFQYAGNGASDPQGCQMRWTTSDLQANGGGVAGACTAGNAAGEAYRGNLQTGPLTQLPGILSGNIERLVNPGQVQGLTGWAVNPSSMRNPYQWYNTVEDGNAALDFFPGDSWNVLLKERTAYGQLNFNGDVGGMTFSGNFGLKYIHTDLDVTQFISGGSLPYGLNAPAIGTLGTSRSYNDLLPAFNLALDLTPSLIARVAVAKNMMPLTLDQWGGGLSPTYQITTLPNGQSVEAVTGASSTGNPNLNPWRSTNTDVSLEWYINPSSILSFDYFHINVASFISNSSVEDCALPDQDGVVRRCVAVTEPVQGAGAILHGYEGDYRQAFTFLPGVLSHLGAEVNATYSPSAVGGQNDLAGHAIPFQDNSKKSGNLVLWYQDDRLQIRLAENYRSKRAVQSNYAGVDGFEVYQTQTHYLDASVSYQVNRNFQVFLQGENLTNERQQFYLVWPSEKYYSSLSERYVMAGVRFKL
ncbi:TonB-dependent receptor [Rhodanobacter sp. Si-c]|uniref:TonB-dependent receptor n=1 Tax=Rhodanobacter lycopersici TaxID=3162487 RepID=A0ABV3QGB9_9GAMM